MMKHFTGFAELQIVENTNASEEMLEKETKSLFENPDWKRETMLANESMNKDESFIAIQHYTSALTIAKSLFNKYQSHKFNPESMVPIVIVSYLNLSEFWGEQGREENERKCLVDAFDYLVNQFNRSDLTDNLRNQVSHGLSKIYKELTLVLRAMGDFNTLEKKQSIYQEL